MPIASVEIADHIATITIAPRGGWFDRGLLDAIRTAAEQAADRDDVRVVVLRADGDFGSGWAPTALDEPIGLPGVTPTTLGIDAVAAIPQPVVVAIRGQATSVALELALAGDIRIASTDARFSLPDAHAGMLPSGGGTQRLPRAVGRAAALRLLLLGEEIDAEEALRIGLVSRVVNAGDLDRVVHEVATTIALRGPIATRLAKEAVHRGAEMPLAEALRFELDLTVLLQSTADRAEGVRAFVEKRPPRFIGR